MNDTLSQLLEEKTLGDEGLSLLLESGDGALVEDLHRTAREVAVENFGNEVYLRGLIEWSNICRNDCLYCGIRKSNTLISRYSLSKEEILEACGEVWDCGIRTFVLQGGENPSSALRLADTVAEIHASWPGAAITLSLGELPFETYRLLREKGADRYLLRHESASPSHYGMLHPEGMTLSTRIRCLKALKELGFQTGMGMMVGSPYQSTDNLIEDIRLMEALRPEMIGIGPFVPSGGTPLESFPQGSADTTLRLYSILRIMFPRALIPSTTALGVILPHGTEEGILAGANVVMPSFTPTLHSPQYSLYDGKNRPSSVRGAQQVSNLKKDLSAIGYRCPESRGDYKE